MGGTSPDQSPGDNTPLLSAALGYAARGWPVFPCNPKNKQPLLAADKDEAGKKIRGTGGVSKATTDEAQIRAWWKRWPKALIGLACGHPTVTDAHGNALPEPHRRLFVLDFDPRVDEASGEVWTLDRLKRETENQIGCPLPMSLTALSPSDGVHLYLLQDIDGPPITNRGNLPDHVDVRGLGGYVIAPPSVMADDAAKGQGGLRYRWHRREPVGGLAAAPESLLVVLRDRGETARPAPTSSPRPPATSSPPLSSGDARDAAIRKFGLAALDMALEKVRAAPSGQRNRQLYNSAFHVASLVAAGAVQESLARTLLEQAAADNPGRDDAGQLADTIDSGWQAGAQVPADLSDVGLRAGRPAASPRRDPPRPACAPGGGQQSAPFRSGTVASATPRAEAPREISAADRERLRRVGDAWLAGRLKNDDSTADTLKAIAWGAGRRSAAGMLDEGDARRAIWDAGKALPDLQHGDIDQALDDGRHRGFDVAAVLLDFKCSSYPMTDFGIAERFRDRFGADFRFSTAKGWLGWDGKRWKVLDQDKDTPPAEVIAAVFDTIRAIQVEARRVRSTGTKWDKRIEFGPRGGQVEVVDEDEEPNPHALDYWIAKGKGFIRYSEVLAGFGRQSESTGKPGAVAALARRWLTVPIEDFDCEQMAVNCQNGTLRFTVENTPDDRKRVAVSLDPHRREDLITRIAPIDYDPKAKCPLYDAMIAWAQPDPATRRYVHQVAGYAISGDTGEHKLWFNYGRGRNGKSTTIDSWCSATGDYSGTIGIESFLDQGIKKRGDAATPDLAKLGGVRMLRASEPERGAKLNAALIKAATGGEPMSVRALHRGFFDLLPRFKLLMSGNSKPGIPDTDDGIWSRMKLVPWLRNIDQPEEGVEHWPKKDPKLTDKIKTGELPGVFKRLVDGLVDYLENGFVEPESVTAATIAYRDQSDPLARFLRLCTEPEPGSRVKSSELHEVFAAWCKAAGEKEWSQKGFSDAMIDKGYSKTRSDGMRWEGLKLIRAVGDFIDSEGRVRLLSDDMTADPPSTAPAPPPVGGRGFHGLDDEDDDLPRL